MKNSIKYAFIALLLLLATFLVGCKSADVEAVDIGIEPPKVIDVQMPYIDTNPTAFDDVTLDAISFEQFETYFDDNRNAVIIECEIAAEGTLLKYEIDDSDSEYKGKGDFLSTTITPIRVLSVHYKGDMVDETIKEGIVLPLEEPYFKVTSDMEEVTESYDVGSFVTVRNYYPMIKGQRYIIYGSIGDFEYRNMKYDKMIFPYDNSSVVCITENGLHAYRRELYSIKDIIQYIGIWLKFSGKDTFNYIYEDLIEDDIGKINNLKIYNLNDEKKPEYVGAKEKNKYVTNLLEKNGTVIIGEVIEDCKQVKNESNLDALKQYEYYTATKVKIKDVYYYGENVSRDNVQCGKELYVLEPYFMVTSDMEELKKEYGENSLITYSGYYPITEVEDRHGTVMVLLYCTFEEVNDTYVIVPMDNSPAVPCVSEYDDIMDIPLRMQVELGPVGVLNYLETYMSPGLQYMPIE